MSTYDAREAIAERLIPKENAIDRFRYVYGGFDDVLLKHIATREIGDYSIIERPFYA